MRTEGRGLGARRMLEWTGVGLNASLAQQSLEAATTTVGWLVVSLVAERKHSSRSFDRRKSDHSTTSNLIKHLRFGRKTQTFPALVVTHSLHM